MVILTLALHISVSIYRTTLRKCTLSRMNVALLSCRRGLVKLDPAAFNDTRNDGTGSEPSCAREGH